MKIHGSNQTNFNPYNKQLQKLTEHKHAGNQKDQLQISKEAKHLQKAEQGNGQREAYVNEIKKAVEAGEYNINYEKTAQKMIAFWSNR
ncbi:MULTISPECIES: flagellar biosynthesis anti-sigma factor FlgM [unclassified Virgibacillus]|uniref:flagellar biosynthesis anti-sigma factor FlgM n=1 Tax=unclassified Virgibacillus TaxID=2620237 RepID=UPI0024DECF6A|nr:flagellar biosynthesis anti-sigma factor FlgM [Virgibacillus sp. LDC-1]